jgi:hypothetical protein
MSLIVESWTTLSIRYAQYLYPICILNLKCLVSKIHYLSFGKWRLKVLQIHYQMLRSNIITLRVLHVFFFFFKICYHVLFQVPHVEDTTVLQIRNQQCCYCWLHKTRGYGDGISSKDKKVITSWWQMFKLFSRKGGMSYCLQVNT